MILRFVIWGGLALMLWIAIVGVWGERSKKQRDEEAKRQEIYRQMMEKLKPPPVTSLLTATSGIRYAPPDDDYTIRIELDGSITIADHACISLLGQEEICVQSCDGRNGQWTITPSTTLCFYSDHDPEQVFYLWDLLLPYADEIDEDWGPEDEDEVTPYLGDFPCPGPQFEKDGVLM